MKTIISIFRNTVLRTKKLCCSAVILVVVLLLTEGTAATAQNQALPFITTWKTNTIYTPTAQHIIFPGWGRNYTIFWTGRAGGRTIYGQLVGNGHTRIDFPAPGTYQVRVGPGSGTFHRFMMSMTERDKLLSIDQWGSINWSSMSEAFKGCVNMNMLASDAPNLSNVTDMSGMFHSCGSLVGNNSINSWQTGHVTNMSGLFKGARNFNHPISNWNTSNVTDMSSMFAYTVNFNRAIGNWNTGKVVNMNNMFFYSHGFNQPIGNWNTSNVTDMSYMFMGAAAFNQPISGWNTSGLVNMQYMFAYNFIFNQPIGNWNTSRVTTMAGTFYSATAFNQPIGNWNTSNVSNMNSMFGSATRFNGAIGNWNTGKVITMNNMFYYAAGFNQPIGNWNTSNVTDMSNMFMGAGSFNQPISRWNTANLVNMQYMFAYNNKFNQPIGNWNTSKVTNMTGTFHSASVFNQPVGNWNTESVTDMAYMFNQATAFNQPLGNWKVSQVKSMYQMLDRTSLSTDNYDQMFIKWEPQTLQRGVVLGAATLTYCKGSTFRNLIVYRYGWVILEDRKDCSTCTGCRTSADDVATIPEKLNLTGLPKSETESTSNFAYPNPASDRLFIKNESGSINSLSITDAAGRIVLKQNTTNINPTGEEISTTQFPSGVYVLTLFQKDGSSKSQKILITK